MPPDSSTEPTRRFLIRAGTARYEKLGDDDQLDSVAKELACIGEIFEEMGYRSDTNSLRENPTTQELKDFLSTWFQREGLRDSDQVVVYYTGHGKWEEVDNDHYLLTRDSDRSRLGATALRSGELPGLCRSNRDESPRQVLVILDTCEAGKGIQEMTVIAGRLNRPAAEADAASFFTLACARPKDLAEPGAFAEALSEAVRDPKNGGRQLEFLDGGTLVEAINVLFAEKRLEQRAQWAAAPTQKAFRFFPNPRYRPDLPPGIDIERQNRILAGELRSHWSPKSRGVEIEAHAGWYFTGRTVVRRELVAWLAAADEADGEAWVVTGKPGSGKSAVLGWLVTLSDPQYRAAARAARPQGPEEPLPPEGAVDLAMHARGKSAQEMAEQIAVTAGVEIDATEQLVNAVVEAECSLTLVVDALDEAAEPEDCARLLAKLARSASRVRLLVGTRQDLIGRLGRSAIRILNLDDKKYFASGDVEEYARQRLLGEPGSPYRELPEVAAKVAKAVAAKAGQSFLMAQVISRPLVAASGPVGMDDELWEDEIPGDIDAALDRDLDRFGADRERVVDLLEPLAFAEGQGLPWENLWAALARAISGRPYGDSDVRWLLEHAGAYLLEGEAEGRSVYRPFHEELRRYLRDPRREVEIQRRIVACLVDSVPRRGEGRQVRAEAHPYVRGYLVKHAVETGDVDCILRVIETLGTIFELIKALKRSTPAFAAEILAALDESRVERLIDHTIDEGRSIATLDLALRELGQRQLPEGSGAQSQLELLEAKLGPKSMLRMIEALGTVFELFMVLQSSTPAFAAEILAALDDSRVERLIDRTIAEGRSIGTLPFALRELGQRQLPEGSKAQTQLELLEAKLGSKPMLRLIEALGTVFDLFMVLKHSTPAFAAEILAALDESRVERLIDRTIAEGRSIGTLDLALRELGQRPLPEGSGAQSQLELLEAKLGPKSMLRLIEALGTVFELFNVLKHSTPTFAAEILAALDESRVERLIDRTIDEGRSIGTLPFALRELGQRQLPEGSDAQRQLELLEAKLGPKSMLRLIEALGTVFELFMVLKHSTPAFAAEILTALDESRVERLIDRTIDDGRSIGTLNLTLRKLGQRQVPAGPHTNQRQLLETLVGPKGWWRLVGSNGDLNHLAYILEDVSTTFRELLLSPEEAPSVEDWEVIIRRGSFYDLCRFGRDSIAYLGEESLKRLRAAAIQATADTLEKRDWFALNTGLHTLPEVEDTDLRTFLRCEADRFLATVSVSDLAFESFSPAVSALSCLWRECPDRRPEIVSRWWNILPPSRTWPKDERFLVAARLLLTVARSDDMPQDLAIAVLRAFCPLPERSPLAKTHSGTLYLFLWNLFALWFERGHELGPNFADLQSQRFWDHLLALVNERTKKRWPKEELLNLLAFIGTLSFLRPDLRPELRAAVARSFAVMRDPRLTVAPLTFIPTFFALQGQDLLAPKDGVFGRGQCLDLLRKASEHDGAGPAIEHLCAGLPMS